MHRGCTRRTARGSRHAGRFGWSRGVRTPREMGAAIIFEDFGPRGVPRGSEVRAGTTGQRARNLLSDLANRKCFRSGFTDSVRSIVAPRPTTESPLWHPPKGAPREPSTSCQSRRAAAMARASRRQRLRRRHPSRVSRIPPLRQDRNNLSLPRSFPSTFSHLTLVDLGPNRTPLTNFLT